MWVLLIIEQMNEWMNTLLYILLETTNYNEYLDKKSGTVNHPYCSEAIIRNCKFLLFPTTLIKLILKTFDVASIFFIKKHTGKK